LDAYARAQNTRQYNAHTRARNVENNDDQTNIHVLIIFVVVVVIVDTQPINQSINLSRRGNYQQLQPTT
jgi:hypothetical protein